ncbi:ABC transporter ATP-binding protein [Rhodococcus sp. IEGM 1381]|uniref:ABC transporter ATP-binding protein n=1 Tax=Rhodococcus sp. IEGM 1381 TaxID=3047085 RepID=UPI0024B83DA1|nr:ABC transporter ATP-binding protein [Rhodococcus sp. IEGM 1381]MDI9894471.1 ABC transporter ATP-binding protein [Rhodococcus sp. IEGM 1381]
MKTSTVDTPLRATEQIVELRSVTKTYGSNDNSVTALDDVSVGFPRGTFTAIMGPSGSGKSTLLQCAAGLDEVSGGDVTIAGTALSGLGERDRTLLRRENIGFVFQAFNLVGSLTAAQNVELPMRFAGARPDQKDVLAALAEVGLAERAHHRPSEMSGGQQQRVALARALFTKPSVLFADEPTGALDTNTSHDVLRRLRSLVDRHDQTVIMVTHDPAAASYADAVLFLADGRIVDRVLQDQSDRRTNAATVAARMANMEG